MRKIHFSHVQASDFISGGGLYALSAERGPPSGVGGVLPF